MLFAGCSDVTVTDVTVNNLPAGWSFWVHDCDRAWLKDRLAGVEHSLHGVARYENRSGLLENAWGWNYLDWVADWKDDGCAPPGASYGKGESAALNLLYLMASRGGDGIVRLGRKVGRVEVRRDGGCDDCGVKEC